MNRKLDSYHKPLMVDCVRPWREEVITAVPDEHGVKRGNITVRSCEEISKEVLDPRVITLSQVLSTGVGIEVKDFANMFNISDPADLDSLRERSSIQIHNYIKEHESEILESINNSKTV